MAAITEDYVSLEIAKLLKEKGFEGKCHLFSDTSTKTFGEIWNTESTVTIPTPTLQMAMKWLREKYNLFIQITVDFSDGAYPMYDACVVDLARCTSITVIGYDRYYYTQACETSIKYCLENLI